ncbi:MAG: chromosomal replication initiator protein DnaA [Prevotella sp.]|nr:chromosomal replication initiator protein DnaA [Prevotella sp.]MDY5035064.1 chromosomal replication initiator protein DnaA [Prevotella sp.]
MAEYNKLWDKALQMIKDALYAKGLQEEFDNWFRPIQFESYDNDRHVLLLQMPSASHSEYVEKKYVPLLGKALISVFGKDVRLNYRIMVDRQNNQTVIEEQGQEMINERKRRGQQHNALPDVDPQLDRTLNFRNYIEGDTNKLSRSVGINIAEHPKSTQFNPMFIYGASGVGKTHLINATGLRAKELYPNLRILYVSARIFQQQYTTAVQNNTVNDFIAFYQTLDMLIVDDIQEWATTAATQNTFFHIFDYLFRHQKRIILASDRSPSQLSGMHERLITRFACGVTIEVERPNTKLCMDILKSKINRDGLSGVIPDDVVEYLAKTVKGSVRDLQGVLNTLMVYSINDNAEINVKLAEKIVKRVVRASDEPLSLDIIVDTVCETMNITPSDVNGKSRKKDTVLARQMVMYLAQKLTSLPSSRIGRLIGGRDHSTVIHSCKKMAQLITSDKTVAENVREIEKLLRTRKDK